MELFYLNAVAASPKGSKSFVNKLVSNLLLNALVCVNEHSVRPKNTTVSAGCFYYYYF